MILAGDIGGTKTNLAVFEASGEGLKPVAEGSYTSGKYASLDEIVREFVTAHRLRVERAGFGVAGPVKNGVSETTNLAWTVDSRRLASALGIATVTLINDLEATAHGISALKSEDFVALNEGAPGARGNAAVVAAGTGLGEAGLFWDGARHRPFPSEGGHTDFAPRTPLEVELCRYLEDRFGHVSYERVLSGPGLVNVYSFLRDTGRGEEPAWLAELMREKGAPAAISRAALEKKSKLCVQALDLFVSIYGAEAGNLALKVMATGGVFVGGGIAPKILEKLKDGAFLEAFVAKGRMRELLQSMPVRVIRNEKTALLGAARCAATQAGTI